jgi:perosamine synthetase
MPPKYRYCGPPGLRSGQLLGRNNALNVFSWFNDNRVFYTHKARTAIWHGCELLGLKAGDEILVPSYNCGSEIDPLIKKKFSIVPYRVDKTCRIDLTDAKQRITKRTKGLYITHYFGFPQPLEEIKLFCEQNNLRMMEDCALSLFSSFKETVLGKTGDVSFFSFPKTFSVPDGGALMINNIAMSNESWKLQAPASGRVNRRMLSLMKASMLRWSTCARDLYLFFQTRFRKMKSPGIESADDTFSGLPDMPDDYYFDLEVQNRGMSSITKFMLEKIDIDTVVKRRRENFNLYLNLFSNRSLIKTLYEELPKEVCPLCFPIIIADRDQICAKLNELLIDAVPFWAGYHRSISWQDYPEACFLKNNILALPVHQDLIEEDVLYIADNVIRLIGQPTLQ